jgi:hypothetical protein
MQRKLTKKQNIDEFNESIQRKSLIRYLTVIIDFSSAARKQEMRPNRAIVIKAALSVNILSIINNGSNLCKTFSI